jgi:hypothetical protein
MDGKDLAVVRKSYLPGTLTLAPSPTNEGEVEFAIFQHERPMRSPDVGNRCHVATESSLDKWKGQMQIPEKLLVCLCGESFVVYIIVWIY